MICEDTPCTGPIKLQIRLWGSIQSSPKALTVDGNILSGRVVGASWKLQSIFYLSIATRWRGSWCCSYDRGCLDKSSESARCHAGWHKIKDLLIGRGGGGVELVADVL
jgi:hypothetical protein